jgi:hypothetical protein
MVPSLAWHKDATVIFRLFLWAMTTDGIGIAVDGEIETPCRSGALVVLDVILG